MGDISNPRIWTDSLVSAGVVGTTAPTDTSTSLNAAFKDLGLVTEDGLTIGREQETKDYWASGGILIRTTTSKEKRTFKFAALEDNQYVFPLVNPGSTQATSTGTTTRSVKVPTPNPMAFVFTQSDGSYKRRLHIARGEVTDVAEIKGADNEMTMFEITITVYASASGVLYTEITTDPAAAVS